MESVTVPSVGHAPTLDEPEAAGGDRPAAEAGGERDGSARTIERCRLEAA